MPTPSLQGTTDRAEDRLDSLRDQLHNSQFADLDTLRRFIDRYATENADQVRSRSTSHVNQLAGTLRSELGLASGSQPLILSAISDHVRDLVMGRAQATEDTARLAVHHAASQVMMYSGQLVYESGDIFIDGGGINFLLQRTYKSQGFCNGPLGVNWDHSYNLRLRALENEQKLVCSSGGFQESTYRKHALYGQSADVDYWLPPPGEHSIIFAAGGFGAVGVIVPGHCQNCPYVLRTADGRLYFYEDDPGFAERYRVCRIQDRYGNYLRFYYRSSGGLDGEQIWRIEVNSPSRVVTFTSYDQHGRLEVVEDYTGRTWRYQYDSYGDLVACTMPGGDRYPGGLTECYIYNTATAVGELQHKLLQVYDTASRLVLENEYGSDQGVLSFGRIVRQREGNGLRTFEYEDVSLATGLPAGVSEIEEDMPAHQTVMVRRNGHAVHYVYNKFGNLIGREEDIWDQGTRRRILARYRYNRDGSLIGSVSPEGRTTRYLYGRDVYMQAAGQPVEADLRQRNDLDWRTRLGFGNRLAVVQQADANPVISLSFPGPLRDLYAAVGGVQDIIVKYSYEPDFQNVTSVSHPVHTRSPFVGAAADSVQANPDFARTLTTFDYDAAGRITRIRYPDTTRDGVPELQGIQERFLNYDNRGRLVEYEDRAGIRQWFSYFPAPAQLQDPDAPKEGYLKEQVIDPRDPQSNPGGLNLATTREVNLVGTVTRITTPKGQIINFVVDELNRVTQVSRDLTPGVTYATRYSYCRNRKIESIERDLLDQSANPLWGGLEVQFFRYDENDNIVTEERSGADEASRLVTKTSYDDGDLRSSVILPRGNRVRIDYDERRLQRLFTRGAGKDEAVVNSLRHDGDGLLIEQRDGRQLRIVFTYDAFGRHVATCDYDEQDALVRLVRQDYDKAGNLIVERLFEPVGQDFNMLYHAHYIHDELGQRLEARVRRFQSPLPATSADVARQDDLVALAEAVRTLYAYDRAGRLIRTERRGRRLDAAGNPQAQETILATTYEYNAAGWLVAERDALGNRTETRYDDHGLVTRVDVREQVPAAISPSGEEFFTTLYEYDVLDRLTAVTDGLGNTFRFELDSRDAVISQEDPLGNVIRYEYDAYGRQVARIREMTGSGLGGGARPPGSDIVTRYEYDANDNLVRLVDDRGTVTAQSYDALDRRVTLRYSDGTTIAYRYDGNDNLVQVRDGNGLAQSTTFDALNLPTRRDIDAGGLPLGVSVEAPAYETFEHDVMRRLTRARNEWIDLHFKHNSLDQSYEERVRFTDLPGVFLLRREFDDFGFVARLTYPSGRNIAYQPDALNRIVRVENQGNGAGYPGDPALSVQRLLLENSYHGLRVGQKAYGNGALHTYAYDAAARIIGINHTGPQQTDLLTLQHLYDAAGNMRRQYMYSVGLGNYVESYGYDSRSQLTLVQEMQPPAQPPDLSVFAPHQTLPPDSPQFDGQAQVDAQLGAMALAANVFTYRYDELGNRLEERQPNHAPILSVANPLNQIVGRGNTFYSYDANGNLVQETSGANVRNYIYNHRNQLARVVEGVSGLARFRHDPLGRRFWREDTAGETFNLYDGQNLIEEYHRAGLGQVAQLVAQYANEEEMDSRFQLATDGIEWWYHKDLIGSTRLLTDSNSVPVVEYRYTPFGILHGAQVQNLTHYFFSGRPYDEILASYDFRARQYSSVLGRLLGRDPLENEVFADTREQSNVAQSILVRNTARQDSGQISENPYLYALNNPFRFADPTGRTVILSDKNKGEAERVLKYMRSAIPKKEAELRNNMRVVYNKSRKQYQLGIKKAADASKWYERMRYVTLSKAQIKVNIVEFGKRQEVQLERKVGLTVLNTVYHDRSGPALREGNSGYFYMHKSIAPKKPGGGVKDGIRFVDTPKAVSQAYAYGSGRAKISGTMETRTAAQAGLTIWHELTIHAYRTLKKMPSEHGDPGVELDDLRLRQWSEDSGPVNPVLP